jgi:hypothetical protein
MKTTRNRISKQNIFVATVFLLLFFVSSCQNELNFTAPQQADYQTTKADYFSKDGFLNLKN